MPSLVQSSHSKDDSDLEKRDSVGAGSLDADLRPANDATAPRHVTDIEHGLNPPAYHVVTQSGVRKVEAATRVWSAPLKIALFIGLAIVACKPEYQTT